MSHTPHELTEEFPRLAGLIQSLAQNDAHFRQLTEKYRDLNRAIHRAETYLEPTDHFHEEEMRKERLRLKDEIARQLTAAV